MIDNAAYRLALAQLPLYRQVYSQDFTILDSYRIALTLVANAPELGATKLQGKAGRPTKHRPKLLPNLVHSKK